MESTLWMVKKKDRAAPFSFYRDCAGGLIMYHSNGAQVEYIRFIVPVPERFADDTLAMVKVLKKLGATEVIAKKHKDFKAKFCIEVLYKEPPNIAIVIMAHLMARWFLCNHGWLIAQKKKDPEFCKKALKDVHSFFKATKPNDSPKGLFYTGSLHFGWNENQSHLVYKTWTGVRNKLLKLPNQTEFRFSKFIRKA